MQATALTRVRLAATGLCLLLAGCVETKVQVKVEPDGSGRRHVEIAMDLDSLRELELTVDGFQQLMDLSETDGWSARKETRLSQGSEHDFMVFARTMEIGSLEEWIEQGGDVGIRAQATGPGDTGEQAHAINDVSLELGRSGSGRSVTYRETYRIEGMKTLMNQFQSERFAQVVMEAHPELTESDRAELRGLYFGHLALQESLSERDDQNPEQVQKLTDSLTWATGEVISRRGGHVDHAELTRIAHDVLVDTDDALDTHLMNELPGVLIAALFTVKLEVEMPGEIVETNADRSSQNYAAWEFEFWSAIDEPLQLYVRSELPAER
jgi:hypothetical protein